MTQTGNESRRKYSKEFKVDAVELMIRSNKSITETAASLGIRPDLLSGGKRNIQRTKLLLFPAAGI